MQAAGDKSSRKFSLGTTFHRLHVVNIVIITRLCVSVKIEAAGKNCFRHAHGKHEGKRTTNECARGYALLTNRFLFILKSMKKKNIMKRAITVSLYENLVENESKKKNKRNRFVLKRRCERSTFFPEFFENATNSKVKKKGFLLWKQRFSNDAVSLTRGKTKGFRREQRKDASSVDASISLVIARLQLRFLSLAED